ncbi:RNA-dependent RNA polymerase [viral metagenome]|uniref:RNA-dependent RNA polymerase n=1 Tax=viral metagenome TaxID=1070528 RepID=A0A6L2ZJD2_9ZZZZ
MGQSASGELRLLFPDEHSAVVAYQDWISTCARLSVDHSMEPLSDDSISRRRSRLAPLRMFEIWGPRLAPVISLYWRLLPHTVRRRMHLVFSRGGLLTRQLGEDAVTAALKGLGGIAKQHRERLFGADWRYFVDLHLQCDYKPSVPIETFSTSVREWVTEITDHTVDGSGPEFNRLFRAGCAEFMALSPGVSVDYVPVTVNMFCSDPGYWARSGSSDGPRLEVTMDDGVVRKARKQKWASALVMTPDEVRECLFAWKLQENYAIEKRELGKVRAVALGDLPLYLKMTYIGCWLDAHFAGHPKTTLYYGVEQYFNMLESMVRDALAPTFAKMPIDQEQFDHIVTLVLVLIVVDELTTLVREKAPASVRSDMLDIMCRIKYALSGGTISVGKLKVWIVNGVLSGWRWTALLGTITNYAELRTVRAIVKNKYGVDPVVESSVVAQGDDLRVLAQTAALAALLWKEFTRAGFKVNPRKFWISYDVDEFLRMVTSGDTIGGYPARAVSSLVWRNPVTRESLRGEERVREMVTSWMMLFSRMNVWDEAAARMMANDVARSNKVAFDDVWATMYTPACVGGMGIPWTWKGVQPGWKRFNKGVSVKEWRLTRIPPMAFELSGRYGGSAEDYSKAWTDNIEGPGKQRITYEGGGVEDVEQIQAVTRLSIPDISGGSSLASRPNPNFTPSVYAILLEQYLREKRWDDIPGLLHMSSRPIFSLITTKCTRAVQIAWLRGRLPFSTPLRPGWSSLATSVLYKPLAKWMWTWCLTKSHVGMDLVRRAAYAAELRMTASEENRDIRVGA